MNKQDAIRTILDILTDDPAGDTTEPLGSLNQWSSFIGEDVVVRTVTMIQVGRLVSVGAHELVLTDAAWVADTGRWHEFLSNGAVGEVEPFPSGPVLVGRGAIVDVCLWAHGPLREAK